MSVEKRAEQCAALMEARGIATLRKAATPWRPRTKGGRIVGAYRQGRAPIDYSGTLRGGSAVYVEVKSTTAATMRLTDARLPAHQRAALDEALRWTPHVYVLAAFAGPPFAWYLLPWSWVRSLAVVDPRRDEVDAHAVGDLFLERTADGDERARVALGVADACEARAGR
jgi:penicillin-binding protein-related factor A (putative recombinase)